MERMEPTVAGFGRDSVGETYHRPQPEGLVAVREFLFTEAEGERVVLLRWALEAEFSVERFSFTLEQMDAAGESLGLVTVTHGGKDIPPLHTGDVFTPPCGIPVDRRCVDIRVTLTEAVSGPYVYRPRGGSSRSRRIEPAFEPSFEPAMPWHYDAEGGKREGLSDEVCLAVESKRGRVMRPGVKALGVLAVLASLILLVWVILSPYLDYLKDYEERRDSAQYTAAPAESEGSGWGEVWEA